MPRIALPDPAALSDRQQEVYDAIASGPRGDVYGPLAIWLHRPDLADRAQALGEYCRYHTSLAKSLSELAILATARAWGSEFEWQVHKDIALSVGVSPAIVEAIRTNQTPQFDKPEQALVYDFAMSVHRNRNVPRDLFDRAVALLGKDGVVDLTGLLGYYGLISMTINVFEVDPLRPDAPELV
jgi:4-carboxymuconolactone decarboxylase